MKILFAIPSKNRSETLKKYTWNWVSAFENVKIFVEPQDAEIYQDFEDYLYVLDEDNKGLGYSCSKIKEYALNNGYDVVFKLDDDIKGFTDFRRTLETAEIAGFLSRILEKFTAILEKTPEVKGFCFPYSFQLYEKFEFETAKRCNSIYVIRTKDWLADPNLSCFEDFATGLYAAQRGLLLKYGGSGILQGIKVGGGEGGMQDFNRYEKALTEIPLLKRYFPGIRFKMVKKQWRIEPDIRSIAHNLPKNWQLIKSGLQSHVNGEPITTN